MAKVKMWLKSETESQNSKINVKDQMYTTQQWLSLGLFKKKNKYNINDRKSHSMKQALAHFLCTWMSTTGKCELTLYFTVFHN